MLDDKHRDMTMDERLFKVTGLATLLPVAALGLLIGFAAWLGFLSAPVPSGVIISIGAAVGVLSALFTRYFHNGSVNLLIVAASGLIALLVTYLGGVYGAIFVSTVVLLVISAAPSAYRVMAGYCMAALLGFTLLLNESFNPSPESLRMLMSLVVVPYPLALLLNTSVPADRARLKGFLILLAITIFGILLFIFLEGFKVNLAVSGFASITVLIITWKLQRIPLAYSGDRDRSFR